MPLFNEPLSEDEINALDGANAPSAANVFATMTDVANPSDKNYMKNSYINVQAAVQGSLASAAALATGTIFLYPLKLPSLLTAESIAVEYISGSTLPFNLKIGLYNLNTRLLFWESPVLTVTVAGTYAVSGLSLNIPEGAYLFAVLHNGTLPVFRGSTVALTKPVLDNANSPGGPIVAGTINRLSYTLAYQPTLPPDLTILPGASSANNSVNPPYIFFKTI